MKYLGRVMNVEETFASVCLQIIESAAVHDRIRVAEHARGIKFCVIINYHRCIQNLHMSFNFPP
jgi:hypothetical protein